VDVHRDGYADMAYFEEHRNSYVHQTNLTLIVSTDIANQNVAHQCNVLTQNRSIYHQIRERHYG